MLIVLPAFAIDKVIEIVPNHVDAISYSPTKDGYCVSFVKAYGYQQYSGDAWKWTAFINSSVPVIGAVVVLDEGSLDHLAIVTGFSSTSLDLVEQNFEGFGIVSTRSIDRYGGDVRGYVVHWWHVLAQAEAKIAY